MLMRDEDLRREDVVDETLQPDHAPQAESAPVIEAQREPVESAPPITSRFMFVNVAGMRARQLRVGAFPRLGADDFEKLGSSKAERVAMEEVRQGLVYWDVPDWQPVNAIDFDVPRQRQRVRKRAEGGSEDDPEGSVADDTAPDRRRRRRPNVNSQ